MNLKKKVMLGMVAGFFAVATIFNMSMLNDNSAGDVSMDAIALMAQADGSEDSTNSCTHTQYGWSENPETGEYERVILWTCSATCSTGGTFHRRPVCNESGCDCI
jgi:hypothetical protein